MHTNKEVEGFGEQRSEDVEEGAAQGGPPAPQNTSPRALHSTYTAATANTFGEEGLAGVGGTEFRLTKAQVMRLTAY